VIKLRGFRLRYDGPPRPLPEIYADPTALASAVTNLLDNATKYSPKGTSVYLNVEQDGDSVLIRVTDFGVGIPRAEQARIFEKFYRAEGVDGGSGSGLGLALVKHIVEAHGGDISVESESGKGSTFTIRMPLRPRATVKERHQSAWRRRLEQAPRWMALRRFLELS
jgi:signal transduction histidine kinase